jgi:hypothetical protein
MFPTGQSTAHFPDLPPLTLKQDYDAGLSWLMICRNQVLTVVLKPICAQVDALAAFLTMLKPETRVYHVAPKAE